MTEDRLIKIETKIAFQEKTIKDLNDVVYEQQKEIDELSAICDALMKRYKELSTFIPKMNAPENVRPPHY